MKEGKLNRKKIKEKGKKVSKNWEKDNVLIKQILMILLKDAKTFVEMKSYNGDSN
jgi:hypothetical protein